jgi:hypothetical protein
MADEALQAELERLRAENAALKTRATKGMTLKVSEKGAVHLRPRALSRHTLHGAVGEAPGDGRRHPRVHRRA